jgi:hypothetical protein
MQTLATDNLGTFCGGSDEVPSVLPISGSGMPRLVRFFDPVARSFRRGHFFMWATVALLEELRSWFLLRQPHSQEPSETISMIYTQGC